jgi:hypothetical protein
LSSEADPFENNYVIIRSRRDLVHILSLHQDPIKSARIFFIIIIIIFFFFFFFSSYDQQTG